MAEMLTYLAVSPAHHNLITRGSGRSKTTKELLDN